MKARNYTVHAPFVRPVTEHDKLREARIENLSALSLQALKSGNTNEFRRLEKELKAAALAECGSYFAARSDWKHNDRFTA